MAERREFESIGEILPRVWVELVRKAEGTANDDPQTAAEERRARVERAFWSGIENARKAAG
jgi:hypothetical protein